ncbi:hypothetical protein BDV06DRAFT_177446 [Aspergillus oleicola]
MAAGIAFEGRNARLDPCGRNESNVLRRPDAGRLETSFPWLKKGPQLPFLLVHSGCQEWEGLGDKSLGAAACLHVPTVHPLNDRASSSPSCEEVGRLTPCSVKANNRRGRDRRPHARKSTIRILVCGRHRPTHLQLTGPETNQEPILHRQCQPDQASARDHCYTESLMIRKPNAENIEMKS